MANEKPPIHARKRPSQARSKQTVAFILEGAARVFRREGFAATTNRIAEAAGVSIGTLYEYFPNKEALLVALAERHLEEAERGIDAALHGERETRELLEELQRAIVASHRYPSQAIDLVADVPRVGDELRRRAEVLRARVMAALVERARALGLAEPEARARAVFGVVAELSSRTAYEVATPEEHATIARELLSMAVTHFGG
ncbi:MAG: TetR/AcrR family transcriptional regulator [Polyangiales bacterium]